MTDQVSSREDVVFSNTVSAWLDLRREFSRQVLRLGSVAFVLSIVLGGFVDGRSQDMVFVAAVLFLIAMGSSMAGMNLDVRVLSLNSNPQLEERITKYDCAIRVFCITSCACIFLGGVFTALAVFCPPQG